MNRLTVIKTPRGNKRLRYTTGLRACRQIADRYNWNLVVRHGQLRMEDRQHA
ncbi:hypothetical protein [Chromohalobacter nigrandesensis]|uniref:hypothetical protein n=1 Tax=Chromohalobacter nigrandesensis TaxID=119863 RepID=UPI001FF4D0AD|nr:hypothetical protein [Chromohalobacter nigrandesensis]MCK0743595.1 hypothetical protein [Chromohalobacter nigrandesensis]